MGLEPSPAPHDERLAGNAADQSIEGVYAGVLHAIGLYSHEYTQKRCVCVCVCVFVCVF